MPPSPKSADMQAAALRVLDSFTAGPTSLEEEAAAARKDLDEAMANEASEDEMDGIEGEAALAVSAADPSPAEIIGTDVAVEAPPALDTADSLDSPLLSAVSPPPLPSEEEAAAVLAPGEEVEEASPDEVPLVSPATAASEAPVASYDGMVEAPVAEGGAAAVDEVAPASPSVSQPQSAPATPVIESEHPLDVVDEMSDFEYEPTADESLSPERMERMTSEVMMPPAPTADRAQLLMQVAALKNPDDLRQWAARADDEHLMTMIRAVRAIAEPFEPLG